MSDDYRFEFKLLIKNRTQPGLIPKHVLDTFAGRNADVVDVTIDHGSASRYHAALVYHKILKRSFIIDLKSSKYFNLFFDQSNFWLSDFTSEH